jgi:hypothetical protein
MSYLFFLFFISSVSSSVEVASGCLVFSYLNEKRVKHDLEKKKMALQSCNDLLLGIDVALLWGSL